MSAAGETDADADVIDMKSRRKLNADLERARKAKADSAEAKAARDKINAELAARKLADAKREDAPKSRSVPAGYWDMSDAQLGMGDVPISNLRNAIKAMKHEPWKKVFVCDELQASIVLKRPVPIYGRPVSEAVHKFRALEERDLDHIQLWLQELGLVHIGPQVAYQAASVTARQRSYHPIRHWLSGLKWDNVPRIEAWLHKTYGVELNEYTKSISRWFLISMIARVMSPGAKVDYMMVLEGLQGKCKSESLRALVGDEYFSDSLPENVGSKDASLSLRGMWLIEAGEMGHMTKSEVDTLKAFVSRRHEFYRPPYAKVYVKEPRQCVFAGTTNKSQYLRDETGARRFWPIKCVSVDLEWLKVNREMLFAEALAEFNLGARWWPDEQFESEHIKPQQEERYQSDAMEEVVTTWLRKGRKPRDEEGYEIGGDRIPILKVTVAEILTECLGLPPGRSGGPENSKVTSILEHRLRWTRGKKDSKSRRQEWSPPADWEAA